MCSCSGPVSPLAKFMQAYAGTPAAQDKAKDKNHDGIVEPQEKAAAATPAWNAPGTGLVVDTTA